MWHKLSIAFDNIHISALSRKYGKVFLATIFVLSALSISLRIYVDSTHYTSPDSLFYLLVAENITSGKGPIAPTTLPFDDLSEESHFAKWPLGYPLLIASVSKLTNTSVLLSSKIVNMLFLGLLFLLFFKWFGDFAWMPALYFFSYGKLEIYSYSWSEGPFLFFLLLLCYMLYRDMLKGNTKLTFLYIFLLLSSLFLLRYAGLTFFFMVTGWMIWHFLKKNHQTSFHYFLGLLLASAVVLVYLYYNKIQSGYFTGSHRLNMWDVSFPVFLFHLGKGLVNELLLIRNYWGVWDPVLIFTSSIQLLVLLIVMLKRNKFVPTTLYSTKYKVLITAGIFYLFSIIILRKITPIDTFDYRMLAPFSTTIFIALFASITEAENIKFLNSNYKWIVGFMLFSLLMNLPKVYLLDLIFTKY